MFQSYNSEFKEKIVRQYLNDRIGIQYLPKKYYIPSKETIHNWIRKYRKGGFEFPYIDDRGKGSHIK